MSATDVWGAIYRDAWSGERYPHSYDVVAIDSSPGAIDVCRVRGCLDARVMDADVITFDPGSFDSVICMGNTIGIGQTPSTLPGRLDRLRRLLVRGGTIVVATIDPLATDVPARKAYHERNLARGLPPALVRTRLEYRGTATPEWTLWLPTESEFEDVVAAAGLRVLRLERAESQRLWTLVDAGT